MKNKIICLIVILTLIFSSHTVLGDEWKKGPVDVPEWPNYQKEPIPTPPDYEDYRHEGGPSTTLDHFKIVDGRLVKVVGETRLPIWEYEKPGEPVMADWEYEKSGEPVMADWEYEKSEAPISNRPEPRIARIIYNSQMIEGQTGYLGIEITNLGTHSPQGQVTLSHSNGIRVLNTSSNPSIYEPGEKIENSDRNPILAKYPVVQWTDEFGVGETITYSLNYKITNVNTQWFKLRLLFTGEGGSWAPKQIYPTEEETAITDQQGWPATQFNVSVSEPQIPTVTLSCQPKKTGDRISVALTFTNSGDTTLRNPAFTWAGKTISGDWDLAPHSSKRFNLSHSSFEQDLTFIEARVTGCFEPCLHNYLSKRYNVSLYVTEDEAYCHAEEIVQSEEVEEVEVSEVSFKQMENAQIIEKGGVVQIIFEGINNFFKMFLG